MKRGRLRCRPDWSKNHFGSLFPVLIRDLASLFRKEEPLERKQRPDHVFADSLCIPLGCSPDLAVDVETGMAPSENLLDQGEADELFPKQQGEDFMGEEFQFTHLFWPRLRQKLSLK